jgi:hypothetical protein
MLTFLTEETAGLYEQPISPQKYKAAKAMMKNAQREVAFKHFCMDLEFLFRKKTTTDALALFALYANTVTVGADYLCPEIKFDDKTRQPIPKKQN